VGVETQRKWPDRAIARTTPCLLALFSLVTLLAAELRHAERKAAASSDWYRKPHPTFVPPSPPYGVTSGASRLYSRHGATIMSRNPVRHSNAP
jgi:hypothetical protein